MTNSYAELNSIKPTVQDLCFKTRLKQTYKDFERIDELDPSMSSLKKTIKVTKLLFASEKQTNEVDNATFSLSCEES